MTIGYHIITWGAVATALVSIFTALGYFGIMPALKADVQILDRKQNEVAIEVYQNKVRSYILLPEPSEPVQKKILIEELNKARRQLESAEKYKIELSR